LAPTVEIAADGFRYPGGIHHHHHHHQRSRHRVSHRQPHVAAGQNFSRRAVAESKNRLIRLRTSYDFQSVHHMISNPGVPLRVLQRKKKNRKQALEPRCDRGDLCLHYSRHVQASSTERRKNRPSKSGSFRGTLFLREHACSCFDRGGQGLVLTSSREFNQASRKKFTKEQPWTRLREIVIRQK
jgi:hypothetical protein